MTDAQIDITDAPKTTRPPRPPTLTPDPGWTLRRRKRRLMPGNTQDIIDNLVREVSECEMKAFECRLEAAGAIAWAREKLPRKEWRRLLEEKRLPIGIRSVQMQCRVGENPALYWNVFNRFDLPRSLASLSELAALKPLTISRLCEDHVITPKMTTRQVKALVRQALVDEAEGKIAPPTFQWPRELQ